MHDGRLQFSIEARDGEARAARVSLPRGSYETPIFMPVGTYATVKAITPEELETLGAQVILSNAYHLFLRPGHERVRRLGGLQRFMGWERLILTDSGGYQLFSLRQQMTIDEDGVRFRSPIDGSPRRLGPERAMAVEAALGSDIAMAFDHCAPSDASKDAIVAALERTTRWARRCVGEPRPDHQARFGIVQGALDLELRERHVAELTPLGFDGYALGGLSVGEAPPEMHRVVRAVAPRMPADRPRYLMGVGRPEDLIVAIGAGIDMFDCVMPTRHARNGQLFTATGRIVITNAEHRDADAPIDDDCSCAVCRRFSRAYLRHLYTAKEILYSRLATYHNLHAFISLVRRAREAIREGRYAAFAAAELAARGEGSR
ncbi:MAG: tRNA guanosine(34) transglycosylase Tgt [Proteobacteria bacterium]|nr:MAG: tRNA guanosine(34) transglycosylase Tgt [Pseudomonadota bacterium]PIE18452.1 MAG: tRNA guanosine(34) transglycosylase Tgt [Pseudomonadota bacterium]